MTELKKKLASNESYRLTPANKNVAASVVAQAKKRLSETNNIKQISLTWLERVIHSDGVPSLHAVFPNQNGTEPFKNDLTFLLQFPNIEEMFSSAYLKWGSTVSDVTRRLCRRDLERYFFRFLVHSRLQEISPSEIDRSLITSFVRFLEAPNHFGRVYHPSTIAGIYSTLRKVLYALDSGECSEIAKKISELIPSGPAGFTTKRNPTEVLSKEELTAIITAAESEAKTFFLKWEEGQQLIREGLLELDRGNRDYKGNLSVCLAGISQAYPTLIPNMKEVIKANPPLGYAILHHRLSAISPYFYPSARNLIPFVILIAVATAFNSDTVLNLEWSNIDENIDQLGTSAIKIIGKKPRASEDQVRILEADYSVDDYLGIASILQWVRLMTTRIRPVVRKEHRDRVFVFVQEMLDKNPKSFGHLHKYIPSSDQAYVHNIKRFCIENKVKRFTLKQIRFTLIDMMLNMTGDLQMAQAVGNHRRPHTTWTFYTSSGLKKRFSERVGEVLVMRERWLKTNGNVDPRKVMLRHDKAAATPGFICLDPFSSPKITQENGKLCAAYGECPSCPLAAAAINDPIAVQMYLALKDSLYRSKKEMTPNTWLTRWRPVLIDLERLLQLVSEDVLESSKSFQIMLPNVG